MEPIARKIGNTLANMRMSAQSFSNNNKDVTDQFPSWNTTLPKHYRGFNFTANETNYGLTHGDLHTGNFMFSQNDDRTWNMSVSNWNNAKKNFFMADLGTVIF